MNLQAIFYIAILAASAIAAVVIGVNALERQKNDALVDEISSISAGISTAIRKSGAAAVVDVDYLIDNDFIDGKVYSSGVKALTNGGDFTAVGSGTTETVTATFAGTDEPQCNYIAASDEQFSNIVAASTACTTAGVLTLEITR